MVRSVVSKWRSAAAVPLVVALAATVPASPSVGAEWHVDDDATCGGELLCSTSVQGAIDSATDGDTVLVHPGIYVENLRLEGKRLELRSTAGPSATVLDGAAAASVIGIHEGADVVIEGFTIRNGGGSAGFTENGFGIVFTPFTEARAAIRDNLITHNGARAGIGIIRGTTVRVEIRSNRIIENFRGIQTDGIGDEGVVDIVNNIVAFNRVDPGSPSGAGMLLLGCCPFGEPLASVINVVNNTIYGNEARYGGGIAANISNLTLRNNILFANSAEFQGADLYLVQAALGAAVVSNVISDGQYNGIDGNRSEDPRLVDPQHGDFDLQPDSPVIDAGENSSAPADDFAGKSRPFDGDGDGAAVVDIGALEFASTTALDRCEESAEALAEDLTAALADLAMCLADPPSSDQDGDGEVDATDRCPGTAGSEDVDDAGCSRAQFCASIKVGPLWSAARCLWSDWRNDEPIFFPRDCRILRGAAVSCSAR